MLRNLVIVACFMLCIVFIMLCDYIISGLYYILYNAAYIPLVRLFSEVHVPYHYNC